MQLSPRSIREVASRGYYSKTPKVHRLSRILTISRASLCQNPTRCPRSFFSTHARRMKKAEVDTSVILETYKRTMHSRKGQDWDKLKGKSAGNQVSLEGYLGTRRSGSKNLIFAQLLNPGLDQTVQVVSTAESSEAEHHDRLRKINDNSPVAIHGVIRRRAASQAAEAKPDKETHKSKVDLDNQGRRRIFDVEIELRHIQCLNEFPKDIIVTEDTVFPPEQRHLQLRTDKSLRDALKFRTLVMEHCRNMLNAFDFLEVETPLLFKSTPEGAREFLVPTRRRGYAYALPQSPQQYKQILMASGISKYFQFARCFRDEDQRADRQPEFTQLDLEMSFAKGGHVRRTVEHLLRYGSLGHCIEQHSSAVNLSPTAFNRRLGNDRQFLEPFPTITYHEAMSKFGSDKPDRRFGMEITRIDEFLPAELLKMISPLDDPVVEVIHVHLSDDPKTTREFVSSFMDSPDAATFRSNPDGQPGVFVYDTSKPMAGMAPFGFEATSKLEEMFNLEDGHLILIQARRKAPFSGGSTALGNLRLAVHRAAVQKGLITSNYEKKFDFLWVVGFPLFSPTNDTDPGQGGAAGLCSTHHPFTAPRTQEDVDKLLTDPTSVTADHYDLILNGVELGGGSRRIHDAAMQELIFRDVLKMSDERIKDFRHLLEVLRAGCPPHAGFALGFDRLIAVLLGKESVRDVIAFPKTGKGEDPLVKSPSRITKGQMETYHLQLKRSETHDVPDEGAVVSNKA